MNERALGPVPVTALRVGRTDVGAATAIVDDDTLTIVVQVESEERPLRVRFTSIDSLRRGDAELELALRDGTRVALAAASAFLDTVVDRIRALPELTRTLRAFGSTRGRQVASGRETHAAEQQRFFAPLLEARRAAFDVARLEQSLADTLHLFASGRQTEAGPAQRALEAELVDACEPLFDALRSLGEAGASASASIDDLRAWRAWATQLRATFETADRVWVALDHVLESAHRASVVAAARPKSRLKR